MGEIDGFVGGSWYKRDECSLKLVTGTSGILCGSLPPRKRLLAGLKQNGLLFSDINLPSPPLQENSNTNSHVINVNSSSAAAMGEGTLKLPVNLVPAKDVNRSSGRDYDEIGKRNQGSLFQRSCSSCTDLHKRNTVCFYCLKACKDPNLLSDQAIWLSCCSCKRFIHLSCELRFSPRGTVDSVTYVCFMCRRSKIHQENGVAGSRDKNSSNGGISTGSAEGSYSSTRSFDTCSPFTKRQRMARERRKNPISFRVEDIIQSIPKVGSCSYQDNRGAAIQGVKLPSNLQACPEEDEVSAAKYAAIMAVKAAAVARATASAKAVAAVKAAAVAKAALEAAALAASEEAHARAELFRRSTWTETSSETSVLSMSDKAISHQVIKSNLDMETEKKDGECSPSHVSFHDEELARLLHRAINSSPRISRNTSPLGKKAREEPASKLTAESFAPSTRGVSAPPSDFFSQSKQQNTKMCFESETHIEARQPDSKIVKPKVYDDHDSTLPENSLPICVSLSYTFGAESSAQQAISTKSEKNLSSLVYEYSSGDKLPLINLNTEHCTSAAIPGECFISRPGWEAAPAVETKIISIEKASQQSSNLDKINFENPVNVTATVRSADIKIKEEIAAQPAMLAAVVPDSKCKHTDRKPSSLEGFASASLAKTKQDKLSKSRSSPEELKNSGLSLKTISSSIRSPTVRSNLPNKPAHFSQANRPYSPKEAALNENCSEDGNLLLKSPRKGIERSLRNILANLNCEKAVKKVDISPNRSRHAATEACSIFAVSEVESAKFQCESISTVQPFGRATLSSTQLFAHSSSLYNAKWP
ncbi:hypothetical protein O6H91_20G057700 [Diphasiastrum complanatum]|uniref:Uncharacterized protein n=4 Tax=Diphasiastrum complanatum TaxID=34168 RepID=A0ACC2AS27_DIPCM|nr:hypothetical protein O6H91_20G057700 [Diphasiastrum complanatum]KAJ7519832.1 hypothetical protein O6H91_20G057700 [Diphasiastrum complanatum]KAJ7519833.1 hypothetical protein O6H91_20G057700 [Diphasiastrum complanatum]KAJ7519834.1 hypothetical protein O6H91_20G057700 [Diphasiastrum complanatum]